MRPIFTIALLLLALPATAGDLLGRLADDDPAVREAARGELKGVSAQELEEMQRAAKDPEAVAALREEAQRRQVAPVADRADALARRLAARAATERELLALDAFAIPVLLHWLDRPEEIPNMFCGAGGVVDSTPMTLDLAARTWLQVLTGERERATADEWKRAAAGWRGRPLAEVVLDGLMRRGYRVRSADAGEAAAALVAAYEGEGRKGWPTPANQWRVGGMAFAARWLMESRIGEGAAGRDLFAPRADEAAPYREWLAANRGFVAWNGRKYTTSAKPADWIAALGGEDREAIAGALRLLVPHAEDAAPAARRHLAAHTVAVARILGRAGLAATAGELPAILGALGSNVLGEDFRPLVTGDALAAFIRTRPAPDLLAAALHALSEAGEPRHAELALEFAKSPGNTDDDPVDWVGGRAALAVAVLGNDGQVEKILPWLKASNAFVRLEVAWPLLRRGRAEAWPVVVAALDSGFLSPLSAQIRLQGIADDLPLDDNAAQWRLWAGKAGDYRWDAAARKWVR